MHTSLLSSIFHPVINKWFSASLGQPTDIQQAAWPKISNGEHVLVTAPTGSGKTLTAFLWALHQLMTGEWPGGQIRVIYISPSKALNTDVQQNLIKPLTELQEYFQREDEAFSPVRVFTRSGDTPQSVRRQMLRKPPEILITTPESLNILISSKNGRQMLTGICSVILDEIHAVAGSKRGTHLMTAVERLVPLCGEFQRIAHSATVNPLQTIADFLGGYPKILRSILPVIDVGVFVDSEAKSILKSISQFFDFFSSNIFLNNGTTPASIIA
jgi:ATP-dependent Lhr-like helicase